MILPKEVKPIMAIMYLVSYSEARRTSDREKNADHQMRAADKVKTWTRPRKRHVKYRRRNALALNLKQGHRGPL